MIKIIAKLIHVVFSKRSCFKPLIIMDIKIKKILTESISEIIIINGGTRFNCLITISTEILNMIKIIADY